MIEAGLLEQVQPAMSVALHVLPMARTGQVVVQRSPLWASRDELTLAIAAPPRDAGPFGAVDLARLAARLTTALYDLVDLEGVSSEPVTFRVRSLRSEQEGPVWLGGTRGELDGAALELNLALYDNGLRARLLERIAEVSAALVGAAGGTLDICADYALPALVNDDHVTGAVERAAATVVGQGTYSPAGAIRSPMTSASSWLPHLAACCFSGPQTPTRASLRSGTARASTSMKTPCRWAYTSWRSQCSICSATSKLRNN